MPGVLDGVSTHDLRTVQKRIASGTWSENSQANDWAGFAVADALGLDVPDKSDKAGRRRIQSMLNTWVKNKALKVEYRWDKAKSRDKPFIVVGEWV